MICTIHQPNFLPYLGFFDKAYHSDIFILYDTTQFKKNDWQNRNKICTPAGWQWLTIPVLHDFGQKITEVKIKDPARNLDKAWKTIKINYSKAPYFKEYADLYHDIFVSETDSLNDLNSKIILTTANILGLKTKFIRSSELPAISTTSTQALADLTKLSGCDAYISGSSGRNYIDMKLWNQTDLKLKFQDYPHPVYKQFNNSEFQSHMCILDLLFNCGDESLDLLVSEDSIIE